MSVNVKQTWIDKVISWHDPVKGLERMRARAMIGALSNYSAAKRGGSSFRNWNPLSNDAAGDILPDLPSMRSRSRDLVRNSPIASGAIGCVVTNVVGTGLRLQSELDWQYLGMTEEQASRWQKTVEREFEAWAGSDLCSVDQALDFYESQSLAFMSAMENGDSFVVLPEKEVRGSFYNTRIQLIESDRVCNRGGARDSKNNAGGIVFDEFGAPLRLQVLRSHPGGFDRGEKKWNEIDFYGKKTNRKNVIHLFDKKRIGQPRGVPYLAPVIESLKQVSRYTEAELVAAVVSGMFTVMITTEGGQGAMLGPGDIDGAKKRNYQLGNGSIIEGLPGDKVETINPGRPNQEFDPFVNAILTQVGIALELPKEVLLKSFNSSYSASRAALLDAWKFFKKRRVWLSKKYCQPIYEVWLSEAISLGRISAPGFFDDPVVRAAYCKAKWNGDGPGSIDPEKEVNAIEKRLSIGLASLAEEKSAYDGGDWEATALQRKKEIELFGSSVGFDSSSE